MELTPFKYIMQNYNTKIGEMVAEIERYYSLSLDLKRYKLIEYKESVDTVKNLQERIFTPYIDERSLPVLSKGMTNRYAINKMSAKSSQPLYQNTTSEKDDLNEIFAVNEDEDIMNSINMSSTLRQLTNDIMANKIDTDRKLQKEAQKLIDTVDEFMLSIKENEANRKLEASDKSIRDKNQNTSKIEKSKFQLESPDSKLENQNLSNNKNSQDQYTNSVKSKVTTQLSTKLQKTDSNLVNEEIHSPSNNYNNYQFQDTKPSISTSRDIINDGGLNSSYNKHLGKLSDRTQHYLDIKDSENNCNRNHTVGKSSEGNQYENLAEGVVSTKINLSNNDLKISRDTEVDYKMQPHVKKNISNQDLPLEYTLDEIDSLKE